MTDPQRPRESPSDLDEGCAPLNDGKISTANLPPDRIAPGELALPTALTPDEQMALFEEDLKENDWGHQPC